MKKIILASAITASIALPVQAVKFEFEDFTFWVNGKSYIFYANTKDESGASENTFSDGNEKTEVEFKFKRKVGDGHTVFGEIELESNVFSDTDNDGDIRSDDIVLGINNKYWGQLTFSKNNDDPVEKYIAEGLEGLGRFLEIEEAETTSSKNNQIQYKSPMYNGFNVILGLAQKSGANNDEDNADSSIVLNYQGKADSNKFGFSIGVGETDEDNDTSGIKAWYEFNKTKITMISTEEENDDRDIVGIGISHKFHKKHTLNLAFQNVDADDKPSRDEWLMSYRYQLFKGVRLYAEAIGLDRENNEGDAFGIGAKFSF